MLGFSRNLLFSKCSKEMLKIWFSKMSGHGGGSKSCSGGGPALVNRAGGSVIASYSTKITMSFTVFGEALKPAF